MAAHNVAIVVQGHLEPALVMALDGFTVGEAAAGTSCITGCVPDQSKLLGLLQMFDGLHIEVMSVNRIDSE